jgi:large subunit ribosomal protein L13
MKTIDRKFHLFDAKSEVLGRIATKIALILRGKNKIDFTPNIDNGDFVVVINSDKVRVTGNKLEGKIYHHFSGYPGGVRDVKLGEQMKDDSTRVIKAAVFNMLPKNKLRSEMIKRLLIYKDDKHGHKIDITH